MGWHDQPAVLKRESGPTASNPGRVRIMYLHHALAYPAWPVTNIVLTLIGIALWPVVLWLSLTLLIVTAGSWYFYFKSNKRHLAHGDTCPAVVVSNNPDRIAVWTDMTLQSGAEHPAILVKNAPLKKCAGGYPEPKTRLAAVCLYGEPDGRRFTILMPMLVECGTRSSVAIERNFESIPEEHWRALFHGLRQVPRPFQPGLYWVDEME